MKIEDVMSKNVVVATPDTPLADVARMMKEEDCGSIPVAEDDRLVGMVTDRDIVIRCLAEGKNPLNAKASDVMTNKVLYCYKDEDTEEVTRNMAKNKIRREPVVDRNKNLVGIVSFGDLSQGNDHDEVTGECLEEISRAA